MRVLFWIVLPAAGRKKINPVVRQVVENDLRAFRALSPNNHAILKADNGALQQIPTFVQKQSATAVLADGLHRFREGFGVVLAVIRKAAEIRQSGAYRDIGNTTLHPDILPIEIDNTIGPDNVGGG